MRAIMVMYDTLCRHFLEPYGNDWVQTPNFTRLSEKAVTFDNNYVCSLPCMPARRDLHNSRVNFLQRDWGPLEPYDDSVPELLKQNGIYSCLVSDHYHYWEDGGCTYHTRYNSWIAHRGQEGDFCIGDRRMVELVGQLGASVQNPQVAAQLNHKQDEVNRSYQASEQDMPQAKTFADGLAFIRDNRDTDNWFLQIETFDPHEPFFTQQQWKDKYPEIAAYAGRKSDWPGYDPVRPQETEEDIAYVRRLYGALTTMCDHYLGQVLDLMDEYHLWEDTMLIVNTDHGFLLGEHDWWGKSIMPSYEEISHTPLFIFDPVSKAAGRREGLTSAIDLPVTLLEYFGLTVPKDMQGYSLFPLIRENKTVREAALFGFHAGHVAVTDGTYTYFRAPLADQEQNCYEYTLMPTRMHERFSIADLQKAELVAPLPNSKGCPVLKTQGHGTYVSQVNYGTKLFDVKKDPRQKNPLQDNVLEARMATLLVQEMKKADAPIEQFERLGLPAEGEITPQFIAKSREIEELALTPDFVEGANWTMEARNVWRAWAKMMPAEALTAAQMMLQQSCTTGRVTMDDIVSLVKTMMPPEQQQHILYFMYTISRAE